MCTRVGWWRIGCEVIYVCCVVQCDVRVYVLIAGLVQRTLTYKWVRCYIAYICWILHGLLVPHCVAVHHCMIRRVVVKQTCVGRGCYLEQR
jgi:hypothetical protein